MRGFGPRQRFTVGSGQQITGIVISLSPQGSISGKVVDEDGKPVPHARVQAYSSYAIRGRLQLRRDRSTTTNEAGEYTLNKLNPGRYFISADYERAVKEKQTTEKETTESEGAQEGNAPVLVLTFFPKSLNFDSATAIQASPGQDAADTNIQLRRAPTYRIRGSVPEANAGGPRKGATVLLSPADTLDSDVLGQRTHVNEDGSFEFRKVLPGSYTLWLTGRYDQNAMPHNRRATQLLGRQDIDVGASDVSGIVLGLTPPVNLTGRVTGDNLDTQKFGSLRVNLVPGGAVTFGIFQSAAVTADGTFSIQNLMPGDYFVHVTNTPPGMYVKQVSWNRQDISLTGMDVSQGGAGEIEIVLSAGAGEVDGTVQADGSAGLTSLTMAVLVPENLPADASGVLVTSTPNGTFTFRNVPPGHYYIFAAERWTSLWQNAEFLREMQRESTPIDLEENGRAQVQLAVVRSENIENTAERLGLNFQ
jgi:protocatechuate 3,4-dioxygenase beta subunit